MDGNGGMQTAGARRLLMDQVDLMDLMDNVGAPRDNPRVCSAVGRSGSGEELPQGYARQCDGNGGVQTAGVWRG